MDLTRHREQPRPKGVGYDILAIALAVFAASLAIGGYVLVYRTRERVREEYERVWENYARKLAATFEPSTGEWPVRAPARIVSEGEGAAFVLEAVIDDERVFTRVSTRPRSAFVAKLVVVPRRPVHPPPAAGMNLRLAGDLHVVASPPWFRERILADPMLRSLAAFRAEGFTRLAYERGRLSLIWPGGETSPARLDAARVLLRDLERSFDRAFVHAA